MQIIAAAPAARKRKHEEAVEYIRIEKCTACNEDFQTNRIAIDKCHYHPGKALQNLSLRRKAD